VVGRLTVSTHPEFVGRFQRSTAAAADDGGTIAAGKRVGNLFATLGAIKRIGRR